MVKKLLVRLFGIYAFFSAAVPSLAGGIYALVQQDHPENLLAYLGLTEIVTIGWMPWYGFSLVGCGHVLIGALGLVMAVTFAFWPDRVVAVIGEAWRINARRISACKDSGQSG